MLESALVPLVVRHVVDDVIGAVDPVLDERGFSPLERDEEIVSDLDGPRRNAATLAALAAADLVVAVVAADPVPSAPTSTGPCPPPPGCPSRSRWRAWSSRSPPPSWASAPTAGDAASGGWIREIMDRG